MTSNIVLNFLGYYSAGALATGITSYFTIYKPILRDLQSKGWHTWELENPKKTALILILVSTILAPALLKMSICGAREDFIEKYTNNLINLDDN